MKMGDLVLYGAQVVCSCQLLCLCILHNDHRGTEATNHCARQAMCWPSIDADIVNTVCACEPSQVMQASQQQEPLLCDKDSNRPF